MKIALINGSPKSKDSASEIILKALSERTDEAAEIVLFHAVKQNGQEFMEVIRDCSALVFAFPLYVDGIPSHLLRLLDDVKGNISDKAPDARVYAVVNNGFYEGRQNVHALEMMRNFCDRAGLTWGHGIGVGAGGMINAAPVGHGPMKKLGQALDMLAGNILGGKSADNYVFEPNFPRFLYKVAAHIGWKMLAKKNGLKTKQLHDA